MASTANTGNTFSGFIIFYWTVIIWREDFENRPRFVSFAPPVVLFKGSVRFKQTTCWTVSDRFCPPTPLQCWNQGAVFKNVYNFLQRKIWACMHSHQRYAVIGLECDGKDIQQYLNFSLKLLLVIFHTAAFIIRSMTAFEERQSESVPPSPWRQALQPITEYGHWVLWANDKKNSLAWLQGLDTVRKTNHVLMDSLRKGLI